MKIIEESLYNIKMNERLCIALGTFDGVHFGHKKIIQDVVNTSNQRNIKSAVLTFDKHPFTVLKPDEKIKLINDNNVKAEIISALGVDYLIFVKFDDEFANIDAREFIELLKNNLNAEILVCGFNYSFGKMGKGNIQLLEKLKNEFNYDLHIMDRVTYHNHVVSSSVIRKKIEAGKISDANILLGYKLFHIGIVKKGKMLGRRLGFPTANIEIIENSCLKNGVYITNTYIDGEVYHSVSNVGYNPTVGNDKRNIETYVFDFDDNLYEKEIKVEFLEFVREEKKFQSVDELKKRVIKDIDSAHEYFLNMNIYKLV
ncbi:MAG: bifunctional riboflavin kinase/FAD synthetase [Clostridiales bacterium]|jgi:riboflavin kinase/FMN adenylyltransferase|nr:bifunctional riboflavin kinase/FAD synthetase [Clostridiales bacterium]